jgi:type IV secretory pathway TrbF-like protein
VTNQFGAVTGNPRYTGIFNILIKRPKTEEEIMKNPLGIMIDSFNFSKQI